MPPPVPGTFMPSTRLGFLANLLPSTAPPTRPTTVPAAATRVDAPLEEEPPPFEPPDPALAAGRLGALDWALLRDAEVCERLPLRELLDLALVPLDLLFVLLDPLRDFE